MARPRNRAVLAAGAALAALALACSDAGAPPAESPPATTAPPVTFAADPLPPSTAPAPSTVATTAPMTAPEAERVPAPPPPGLDPVGMVEALGGRLEEGSPPRYPPEYVDGCWDGLTEAYYLYVVDGAAADAAALDPHRGDARLETVAVEHSRDRFLQWEEQAREALRRFMITASANLSVVSPEWPSGDRFCSPEGPYLRVEVHDETQDEVVADALAALPPELVLVVRQDQSQFLSEHPSPP